MGPDPERPTTAEMLQEILDLGGALGIVMLPLFLTAVPGVLLFFVLPAVLLLAVLAVPVIVVAVIAAPPVLIARALRRWRERRQVPVLASA